MVRACKGNTGTKWYGGCTGKTVRGRYRLVRAKKERGRYGLRYGARCGNSTGPARFPMCSLYRKYTGRLRVPVPPIVGSVGTARTVPSMCPYRALNVPVPAPYGHVYWVVSTRTLRNLDFLPSLGFCSDYVTNPLLSRVHRGNDS